MLSTYYKLIKPGIVGANAMTAIAGFLFASVAPFDWQAFVGMTIGLTLMLASSCIANNYIDRFIDSKMMRTKNRPLVTGQVSALHALVVSIIMGLAGLAILVLYTNILTVIVGIFGFVSYVGIYGYVKRKSYLGTAVGTLPGGASIVAGYVTSTGTFDRSTLVLLIVMAVWQMAHFYTIAIFRKDEYKSAGIPVISVVKGIPTTKNHIIFYTILFIPSIVILKVVSDLSIVAYLLLLAISFWWIKVTLSDRSHFKWAQRAFGGSLVVLTIFSIIISIDGLFR